MTITNHKNLKTFPRFPKEDCSKHVSKLSPPILSVLTQLLYWNFLSRESVGYSYLGLRAPPRPACRGPLSSLLSPHLIVFTQASRTLQPPNFPFHWPPVLSPLQATFLDVSVSWSSFFSISSCSCWPHGYSTVYKLAPFRCVLPDLQMHIPSCSSRSPLRCLKGIFAKLSPPTQPSLSPPG